MVKITKRNKLTISKQFTICLIEMKCIDFPDSDNEHTSSRVLFNPMSEYINRYGEDYLQLSFDKFTKKYGYKYRDEHEHGLRLKIFRHNNRYVNTHNRAALSYKMKLNKFADRTVSLDKMSIENCFLFDYFFVFSLNIRTMNYERFVVVVIQKVITAVFHFA